LEVYVGGGQNNTPPTYKLKGNNTLILEAPYLRVSEGTLRIGDYKYTIPMNISVGLYLYMLMETGNAPVLEEALSSPLVDALQAFNST
jgi:hypothetical protein